MARAKKTNTSTPENVGSKKQIPYSLTINIAEFGDNEKSISYEYREKATERQSAEFVNKNYNELTDEQKAIYDAFVNMIDSFNAEASTSETTSTQEHNQ